MAHLFNRNVLLGISGGIAAYKSAELVRQLRELGAEVRVIMTRGAQEFITPLTLQALSGKPVHTELLDAEAELGMGHIELARWADLLLVAPATADLLARLAAGRADDLLTTVALATAAPRLLAPAMNQQMWNDPATLANVATLQQRGMHFVGPAAGVQACGDVGPGRMEEPAAIAQHAAALFDSGLLAGQRVVITAGPTREALDPVRYISNHSSGRMGFALARAAVDAGARTTLVSGPVQLATPAHVRRVDVESAQQMLDQCLELLPECDIFIACAAVADYRPATFASQKIKKGAERSSLELVRNPDIVATVAASSAAPFTVGFAAETSKLLEYAQAKMENKQLDMIVANDVAGAGIGFNSDENAATVLWPGGSEVLEQASKLNIARRIIALIAKQMKNSSE
ncbi:bifunctional phosphopantothenoylcysteine decarboxylase/phosphopantothenate--cysteine ligase CoaBC [Kineobactrum salinum]|uniref:Coenzyme A biosynthesis bifunctional protein CoaBC n=1 Tax=Kineobactrum salinum TaxID=2708301 RepID=A0A6C0U0K6_9GAMM|nr:bifunctional phosphopantothenoylcysteine decarboxylase/phosphopantothenate--cysteine ligase CoaBC [Kineobactrum salinum]QIB65546.1 bifunctional phosphopantothenoylcysteine decarboxylase/phosphopantothenate--cysteine ligase CoaBC [Kineobactrum salinum]